MLPPEIRERLKRMERRSAPAAALAVLFFVSLAGALLTAALPSAASLRIELPAVLVFAGLGLGSLAGWLAEDRGRRVRLAEFQLLAEMLHRYEGTELAMRDGVTGAYNRVGLEELQGCYARRAAREKTPLALARLEIEHYDEMVRSYGAAAAELALAEMARLLRERGRGADVVARHGRSGFAVLLANGTRPGAEVLLQRLGSALADGLTVRGSSLPLSLSAGVAVSKDGASLDEMLQEAELDRHRRKTYLEKAQAAGQAAGQAAEHAAAQAAGHAAGR